MSQTITLVTGATGTNGPPSSLTDATLGVAIPQSCDKGTALVWNTAGSGTITVGVRMWGYYYGVNRWLIVPGSRGVATNGGLFDGNVFGEAGSDIIAYAEVLENITGCSRLYAELTFVGGTSTAVTVAVQCHPRR